MSELSLKYAMQRRAKEQRTGRQRRPGRRVGAGSGLAASFSKRQGGA